MPENEIREELPRSENPISNQSQSQVNLPDKNELCESYRIVKKNEGFTETEDNSMMSVFDDLPADENV